jgi:hypothetical protein
MKSFVVVIVVLATCIFAAYAYFFTPSVSAVRSAAVVTVHFELLGEYPQDVQSIEIVDVESGNVVWRVRATGEMFQLHKFNLVAGPNSGLLQPFWGSLQTEIPKQPPFILQTGIGYRTSVCFATWLKLCRSTNFRF